MTPYTYAEVNALRPRVLALMEDVRRRRPDAWAVAHKAPAPAGDLFARLVAREGQLAGIRIGVNGKRGNVADLSQDCVAFPVESGGAPDATGRFPGGVVIIDFIVGAGTASADLGWIDQTGPTIAAGTRGAFVQPVLTAEELVPPGGGGTTTPPPVKPDQPPVVTPPPAPCQCPPPDLAPVLAAIAAEGAATRAHLSSLIDAQTKRQFGLLAANGARPEPGIADLVIQWLQTNRVRVKF